jgi:hypothetical protein
MDAELEPVIAGVPIETANFRITPLGIQFHGDISRDEWEQLGRKLGNAGRSIGFLIGDWLNYGNGKGDWGNTYTEAMRITGLDHVTLAMYARVSRCIQIDTRVSNLAFELHRKVAPIKDPEEQKKWLKAAEKQAELGKPMSSRRLAKSILLRHLATEDDMTVPENDRGRDSPQLHIQRIITFWKRKKKKDWLKTTTLYRIRVLMEDFQPLLDIYDELYDRAVELEGDLPEDQQTVPVDWRDEDAK